MHLMQKICNLKGHDDDSSSKEEPAKEEAPAEQAPVATQTEEVDEKAELLKQCLQYVNTHVKKVLTLKQFLDLVKMVVLQKKM